MSCLTVFLKSTRPSFFDKAGCTRQFESELSLRSLAPLFPIKEGSTSLLGILQWSLRPLRFPRFRGTETSGEKRKPLLPVALNRFAIRLTDHQRSRQVSYAGWERMTIGLFHYQIRCFSIIFLTSEIL